MTRILSRIALVAALLGFAGNAFAATATSNITVTATVIKSCQLTAGTVAFGNYDPLAAANTDATGTFTVACNKGTAWSISLGLGANASGAIRRMTDGTNFLTYELYNDAGRTTVWNAVNLVSGVAANKTAVSETIYGRVTAGQDLAAASFTDTVVATVTF
ncbi:MAG TPA: spore coat U domain-containing protein [Anaeromyxobacteraceae bacterium]|nr:spore coat U domain-containing protein [Anaeromyxobacteraceae bacterium]